MSIARLCPPVGPGCGLFARSPGQPLLFPGLLCDQVALTRHGSGPRMERCFPPLKQADPQIQDPQSPHFLASTVQTL